MRNPVQLGGCDNNRQPIGVEIDESYSFHRKYHRVRVLNGVRVFGAVERERAMSAASGARPNCPMLLPIIQQWRLPGTHIMSDGWAAYNNVAQINGEVYLPDVVVHQVTSTQLR